MNFSFQKLMTLYMTFLIIFIFVITAIFMFFNVKSYFDNRQQIQVLATNRVTDMIERYQAITSEFGEELSGEADVLDNLEKYFTLSPSDYATFTIDQSLQIGTYFSWEREVSSFFIKNPEVKQVELRMSNSNKVYLANQKNRSGYVRSNNFTTPKDAFTYPLLNPQTLKVVGTLKIQFTQAKLKKQLQQLKSDNHLQIVALDSDGHCLFNYADRLVTSKEKKTVANAVKSPGNMDLKNYTVTKTDLAGEYQIYILFSRQGSEQLIFDRLVPIFLIGSIVLIFLLVTLRLTFKTYQRQLLAIFDVMHQVSQGNLKARVVSAEKYTDLSDLVSGINYMLDEIDRYVYTIYQLQIAQQDANMKALRSQINPHFMANTLEYIRMAALDADQIELAKVIYSFSALLQNNVDQAPVTTFGSEINFIDKYIYLYQVRYPDKLAYQIQLDENLKGIEIPKFTLQPLVENYFVHGVDFRRNDNVISLKAYQQDDYVVIEIINNGASLSAQELASLNVKMTAKLSSDQRKSIGLQNVYARAASFFGPSFNMRLQKNQYDGVTVLLRFKPREDGNDESRIS